MAVENRVGPGVDPAKFLNGAVHKGRPQRRGKGMVKRGHLRTGGGGKGPCGRPQDGTF